MIRNSLAVAWKDLLIVLKDKGALAVYFLMPLLFASLLGMAFGNAGNDETTIEIAVLLVNQDSGSYGQMLADGLKGAEVLVVEELNDATLADQRVANGDASAALVIPADLSGQDRRRRAGGDHDHQGPHPAGRGQHRRRHHQPGHGRDRRAGRAALRHPRRPGPGARLRPGARPSCSRPSRPRPWA